MHTRTAIKTAFIWRGRVRYSANTRTFAPTFFGHTHDAFLIEEDGRVIFNTGTWLKILRRVPARFRLLPAIYDPTFRLNFFKVCEENGQIVINYVEVPKKAAQELTLLERVLTVGRKPADGSFIPPKTILKPAIPTDTEVKRAVCS